MTPPASAGEISRKHWLGAFELIHTQILHDQIALFYQMCLMELEMTQKLCSNQTKKLQA